MLFFMIFFTFYLMTIDHFHLFNNPLNIAHLNWWTCKYFTSICILSKWLHFGLILHQPYNSFLNFYKSSFMFYKLSYCRFTTCALSEYIIRILDSIRDNFLKLCLCNVCLKILRGVRLEYSPAKTNHAFALEKPKFSYIIVTYTGIISIYPLLLQVRYF